ncbi:MAG: leishmanolysin-related zinc metalloendopeptidase [Gemmatimonadales bacterium]
MSFRSLWILVASLLALVLGCGDGGTEPTGPTALEFLGGLSQTGQVGTVLPIQVIVKAKNRQGHLAGVMIRMATETQGGGSVSPVSATTGENGTAEFTWTLGGKTGTQTLTASTTGQSPLTATITAVATVGPPSAVVPGSADFQLVVVGRAVSILPSVTVTDRFGNAVSGVPVQFEAIQGTSTLSGASQTSNAQGIATLGGWIIGLDALVYMVQARASTSDAFSTATFEARGIPAVLVAVEGTGQDANAGTAVPVVPAVRAARDDGSPLPNVPVDFTVVTGGGSVTGGGVSTGVDGVARPIRWVLGPNPGQNRLQALTFGREPVGFEANGTPGVPATVTASGGTNLAGLFGNYLAGVPEITLTDAQGRPVAQVPVTFQVTAGDGRLTGSVTQTDFLGRASPTSWRLGPAGPQLVSASAGSFPPIDFAAAASAPPTGSFRIELRYLGTVPNTEMQAAFDSAEAQWARLILAGAPPYQVYEDAGCGDIRGETVDGIVIMVVLRPIDGTGKILGAAGPCILRDQGYLPAQGYMEFDTADLNLLLQQGQLAAVITHEMAHVLGFGTIWNFNPGPGFPVNAFLLGRPGADPTFSGLAARAAFFGALAQGTTFAGTPVPVEGTPAAPGTAYSHWRKSVFQSELMTGFLSSGVTPLSAVTVQSFRDLGYTVNDAGADPYTLQAFLRALGPQLQLIEGQLPGDLVVINRRGRGVTRIPRTWFR